MKKIIALILAMAMIFSLALSVGAADFTDAAEIDGANTEAVTVLSSLGIIAGMGDGKFQPKTVLTRAQAAKIICCLLLGVDGANALPAAASTFSDVPTTHWSSKFVEYCAANGIVSGIGGGKFGPDSKLTGFAFGKMLLCGALGYDAEAEGLVGEKWGTNTYNLLKENRLNLGVTVSNSDLTRENACHLALNTLFFGEYENPEDTLAYKVFGVYRSIGAIERAELHQPQMLYISNEDDKYWPGSDMSVYMSPFYEAKNEVPVSRVVSAMLGDEVDTTTSDEMYHYRNGMGWIPANFNTPLEANSRDNMMCTVPGSLTRFFYDGSADYYYFTLISNFGGLITSVTEAVKDGDTVLEPGSIVLEEGVAVMTNDFTAADVGTICAFNGLGKTTWAVPVEGVAAFRCTPVQGKLLNDSNKAVNVSGKTYTMAHFAENNPESYIANGGAIGDDIIAYMYDNHCYGIVKAG